MNRGLIAIRDRILAWFCGVNSKFILLGGFAIVLLLGLLPTLYSQWAEDQSSRTVNRFVDIDHRIADLSLTSITRMIKVRRNEKDFLLTYRDFGFDEAKARYITTLLSLIGEIKENMKAIRQLTNDPEILQRTNEIDYSLVQYQAGIMSSVELYGVRGSENSGLEANIRAVTRDMITILGPEKNDRLMIDLLSMQLGERNFIINDLDIHALNIQKASKRFREDIGSSGIAPDHKKKLLRHVNTHMMLFEQYVQITERLRIIKQAYLKSLQNVEPTLEKLNLISVDNTYKARNNIRKNLHQAKLTMIVSFLLALLFSAIVILFVVWKIRETEEQLRISETKYRTLFETSPDAITIMDMNHDILIVNQQALTLLQCENPSKMFGRNITDIIMPEDAALAETLFKAPTDTESPKGVEFRMRRKDGSPVIVECAASTILDILGNPESIIVAARDITERKQAENTAREAQEYARYLINSSLDMIIAVDTNRRIVEFNKAAENVFGYRKDEVLGKHVSLFYLDANESARVGKEMLETGLFAGEVINKRKNHGVFPAFLSASIIKDHDGHTTGYMGISRDITEIKKIEQELVSAATMDKLTGIYNRRMLENIFDREIERTTRHKNPLSLIMIDLDHFKKVNDTYGHLAGDLTLQTLANIVKPNIRKSDYFGRWGGEEFLIVATEATRENAFVLAEKIRRVVEGHQFDEVGSVTLSCGIAQYREGETVDDFMKRADDALYRAKSQGRNRVVM
jgi:diguanylate cyclase (GGDEF)-like protein/PAS domain S-box-containing protein